MTKTRDLADLGGGFIQAGTGAVQRTVESKLQDVVSVLDFIPAGINTATTDCSSYIQAAFDSISSGTIVFPARTYNIQTTINVTNKSVNVEAIGAKFLVTANVSAFIFDNSESSSIYTVTSNYSIGSTNIAVSTLPAALVDGTPFKIVSNAVDPANRDEGSNANQYRVGEWAVASGGTTTNITLRNPLRFTRGIDPTSVGGDESKVNAYTTTFNTRVLIPSTNTVNWSGGTVEYEDGHDGDNWNKASFTFIGFINPKISDITILRGYGPGINIKGTVAAKVINCEVKNLTDNTANSQFGYGILEGGCLRTNVDTCSFSNCRHGYATGVPTIAINSTDKAALITSGRTQSSVISNCTAYGKTVSAFDTHHDAEDTIFNNCIVEGGDVGFAPRGRNITFNGCKAINTNEGFNVFTEFDSGDPDDDLWVSGKPEGVTTATLNNCTAYVINIPVVVRASRKTILNSLDLKSTSHIMVDNDGSNVLITGNHFWETTTYDGQRVIKETTNRGIIDSASVATEFIGMWDSRVTIAPGAGITVNATQATDASNNILLIRHSTSGIYLDVYGVLDANLSTSFTTLISNNAIVSGKPEGGIYWSIDGAADNTITTNLIGKFCKAKALDNTVVHDWVTPDLKAVWKNPEQAHAGTGAVVTDVFRPEVEAVSFLDEAGHKIKYRLWFNKAGTAGVATLTLRIGADFFNTVTIPTTGIGAYTEIDCYTRADNDQRWHQAWFTYASPATLDTTATGQFKTSLETTNLGGLTNYALSIDVDAAVGDTITLEQYEVSCDLLSNGVI